MTLFSRTDSLLVCVQSSWFVGEADVARIVLASHNIPCHVENEFFHTALWLYANITGGFKVQVPREHAEEAARILLDSRSKQTARIGQEPWRCGQCGWTIDGDWDVCWFCAGSRGGAEGPHAEPQAAAGRSERTAEIGLARLPATAVLMLLLVLFVVTKGSLAAVLLGASVALLAQLLGERLRGPFAEPPSEEVLEADRRLVAEPPAPAEQSYQRRQQMGNRVVERALTASIMAVSWLPPLALLSAALLCRLDRRRTPCEPGRRYQVWTAWCLNALAFAVLAFWAVAIARDALDPMRGLRQW